MKKKNQLNLSAVIRGEMNKKRVSQADLGRRSGVRLATISDFLNGKQEVQTHNLERILTALNGKLIFTKNQINYAKQGNIKR